MVLFIGISLGLGFFLGISTMISFGDRGFWGLNWQHSGDGFIRFVIAKFVCFTNTHRIHVWYIC